MTQTSVKTGETVKARAPRGKAREALLEAARTALIEGEGQAEMADIAKRAGLSVGLAYHHFGSKDGLIAAVVEDFYARYSAIANDHYPGTSWAERESTRTRAIVKFMVENPFTRTIMGPMGRQAETIHADASHLARLIELGARNIASGQKSGEIPSHLNPAIAASFVLGGVRQSVAIAMAMEARPDIDRLSTQIWGQIAASLHVTS